MSYSSYSTTHVMAMPAVLSKVTATGYQLSLKYVHDFSLQNLRKLSTISNNFLFLILTEAVMTLVVAILLYIVWRKTTSTRAFQPIEASSNWRRTPSDLQNADFRRGKS